MAMKLKIAKSAKELDDVFWLRHEVYIIEDGKFGGQALADFRIVDRYDAFPECANIIAYDGDEPVGTLRISLDSELGLPSDEYFDFQPHREQQSKNAIAQGVKPPLATCAGMLAVRKRWKSRRDVIRALIKTAVGVWHSWGVTHVYATVNHDTVGMYDRLGFSPLSDKIWIESIGNHIVPIAANFETLFNWAFGHMQGELLEAYSGHFERLLLKSGETLFSEGDSGDYAYLLDEGVIKISRNENEHSTLTLATLNRGEIFGELALIDTAPRSATATAMKPTEVIILDRETFQNGMRSDPRLLNIVMKDFANRIRRMDELAMVLAFGEESHRLRYAVDTALKQAKPDTKDPNILVARIGPNELANLAGVNETTATAFLDSLKQTGELDYKSKAIHFFPQATTLRFAENS